MLLIIREITLINPAIIPRKNTVALHDIIFPEAPIYFAIGPGVDTSSVHFIFHPLAGVLRFVAVGFGTLAVF